MDAFEYVGLEYLDKTWVGDMLYHQASAAIAGNGLGLCKDFKDKELCRDEEDHMASEVVLSVMFTTDCLCVELANIQSATYLHAYRVSPSTMDFTLGTRYLHDNPSEIYYWEAVKDTILRGMVVGLDNHEPEAVFVMGDESRNPRFRKILEETLLQYMGKLPKIFDEDPVFRAAQGAAEMARRRSFVL